MGNVRQEGGPIIYSELEFDTRRFTEQDRIAERLGTKKKVHSTEQERKNNLTAKEVASQGLQKYIDTADKRSPGVARHWGMVLRQELPYNLASTSSNTQPTASRAQPQANVS